MSTSVKTPDTLPLTYRAEDGVVEIDLLTDQETMWLTQAQMATLFNRTRTVIGNHIANVFNDGELHADSVSAKFALTAADGKSYDVQRYNLDVVISVGYRVKSKRGAQFRQ